MFVFPTDDVTVFSPSTFYLIINTIHGLQLEIQLTPVMQVFIKADVSHKGNLKGGFPLSKICPFVVNI